ncbi:MAG: four helix bundle protein [Syntrophobacteraceae bacterium]|jgi:four helix bundle protein
MPGFQELKVWQGAKDLAVEIYRITQEDPFTRDFSLRDQIRRAAVSVPSNIAEGDERGTNKEAVRFLYIAKGSLAELRTQLQIAHEIGYLGVTALKSLDEKCRILGNMLGSLINVRRE